MKIKFSKHALERMEERSISKQLIGRAINNPTKVDLSSKHNDQYLIKYKYKASSGKQAKPRLLLIICKKDKDEVFVITVIDTSKINKYI